MSSGLKRDTHGFKSLEDTTFSGISSYRTEPYKSNRDDFSFFSSPQESYQVARTHFDELNKHLASHLAKEPANSRSTARQKLTRLTRQQFQELSTDVYDELTRRKANADNNQVPFLPVCEDFHPKRNQARQKLAILPITRFDDLSSDVYHELVRRYPELKEEACISTRRTPSPTNPTPPGTSSYLIEPYKPHRDKYSISPSPQESHQVARTYFDELTKYLASYLAKEPANSRSTARQKLTRLTRQQFQELSTDVYDELIRRENDSHHNQVPFLPVREDFHPKRNQARQKLATLPTLRFKDLSSDVYHDLVRRYPEFKDEPSDEFTIPPESTSDDFPSPDFPSLDFKFPIAPLNRDPGSPVLTSLSKDR